MSRSRRVFALCLVTAAALALVGCSPDIGNETGRTSAARATPEPGPLTGGLVVFAATSLQDTFTQIGDLLTADNPDLTVTFNFGSSGTLSTQLVEGAPADVFASANATTMADAASVVNEPALFTRNSLVIVVPTGNPAGVEGLADFTNADLKIALCDPAAPCGAAAQQVFTTAGLTAAPDTLGQDVKATLNLVTAGEVDAALVYQTDPAAAGDAVETVTFPEAAGVVNDYPIATLKESANLDAAEAFVALVLSPEGQEILTDAGFGGA